MHCYFARYADYQLNTVDAEPLLIRRADPATSKLPIRFSPSPVRCLARVSLHDSRNVPGDLRDSAVDFRAESLYRDRVYTRGNLNPLT